MKIIIPFLILLLLFSTCLFSQERGFKVVRTPQGKEIALYKGSYALVVGNGKYTAGWDELLGAVKDAEEIADVLRRKGFRVTLVKNVDKRTLLSEFSNFTFRYGQDEDNQLLFYYAGHGHTTTLASEEELGYLVMVDAPLPEKDPQEFDSKSVDMKSIITWALKMKSKHVLFMFDSCFSGTVLNLRERVIPKAISDAVRYPVRQFITAGRAAEPVPDRSVFKQLLIDILEGRVEEPIPDGYITGEELGLFLKNKVPEYNKFQHPQYGKIRDPNLDKGDFVFVLEKARLGVQEEIPTPPKAEKLDLSSIEESAKRREEARRKWSNWQEQMESDSIKVKRIDQNPENTAEEKKNAWEAFLRNYKTDNPYSNKDEQLRQRATQRLKALSEEKPRAEMDANAFIYRGASYDDKGLYDKAISDYTRAIEIDPKNVLAYYNRGFSYNNKGLYDKAISDYTRAIEINPKFVEAFINRGLGYNNKGLYDKAISDLTRAIEINPKQVDAFINRGASYNHKGLYDKAISDLTRAIEINPKYALAFYNKALSCEKVGRINEALEAYKAFIQNASPDKYASYIEKAKKKIIELEK